VLKRPKNNQKLSGLEKNRVAASSFGCCWLAERGGGWFGFRGLRG